MVLKRTCSIFFTRLGAIAAGVLALVSLWAAAAELSDEQAIEEYNKIQPALLEAYQKSATEVANEYSTWQRFNTAPYPSSTHGKRYVNNYANAIAAETYGQYENLTEMPVGSILVKDSFKLTKKGKIKRGPLFIMEKMEPGFNEQSRDWRYSAIMPNGKLMGITGGEKSKKVEFCHGCHIAMGDKTDSMTFLPEQYRTP